MANLSKKTGSNVFYKARSEASTHNDQLSSREGAADLMGIDRGRLFRIESGVAVPYPEEILLMANLYGAPELVNYFCTTMCPLGADIPRINAKADLNQITVSALASFRKIGKVQNYLIDISNSNRLSAKESEKLDKAIEILEEIGSVAESLKIWKKKNL